MKILSPILYRIKNNPGQLLPKFYLWEAQACWYLDKNNDVDFEKELIYIIRRRLNEN